MLDVLFILSFFIDHPSNECVIYLLRIKFTGYVVLIEVYNDFALYIQEILRQYCKMCHDQFVLCRAELISHCNSAIVATQVFQVVTFPIDFTANILCTLVKEANVCETSPLIALYISPC
jgi:hypothetical protein